MNYPYVVVLNEHDSQRVRQIGMAAERLGAGHVYTVGKYHEPLTLGYPTLEEALDNIRGTWVPLELTPGSVPLAEFTHPEDAVYVVGPQIGSLPPWLLTSREAVAVETAHNSASDVLPTPVVVGITLHHRLVQQQVFNALEASL